MPSSISNTLYPTFIPEATTDSILNREEPSEVFLIDESYEGGLCQRVCGLLSVPKLSGRVLLIGGTGCLITAIFSPLVARYFITISEESRWSNEMTESTKNRTEEIMQYSIEYMRNEATEYLQEFTEDSKKWSNPALRQDLIDHLKDEIEKNMQFLIKHVKQHTKKVVQIFINPNLRKSKPFGWFWLPTGALFTLAASVSAVVVVVLKSYQNCLTSKETPLNDQQEPPALPIEESYEDQTFLIGQHEGGLYRKMCGFLSVPKLSGRALLVGTTGCLVMAISATLFTRYLITISEEPGWPPLIDNDLIEFTQNQTKEVMQSSLEHLRNESEKLIQAFVDSHKEFNTTEKELQEVRESMKNETEENIQFFMKHMEHHTKKVAHIFIAPKLRQSKYFGWYWPSVATIFTLAAGIGIIGRWCLTPLRKRPTTNESSFELTTRRV